MPKSPALPTDGEAVANAFFEGTGASYDRVVAVTTFGLDRLWKRRLLAHVPENARRVLDLACGTGIVTQAVLDRCPDAEVVGVDLTPEYLDVARRRFARSSRRVTLIAANAEEAPLEGTFDAVVSSYIPKYVDAARLLANLDGHLAPGAAFAVHDFTIPKTAAARAVWTGYMRVLASVGLRVFPEWEIAFDRRLETLIRQTRWVRAFYEALQNAGFSHIAIEGLSFRSASVVSARAPGVTSGS